jgi:hypothetical protein
VEDATALLLDFVRLCVYLFPDAKTIEAPYEGTKDKSKSRINDTRIMDEELYSRNLWNSTGIGMFRTHDKVIVYDIKLLCSRN